MICIAEEKRVTDRWETYNCAPAARIAGVQAGITILQTPTAKERVVGNVVYRER